MEKREPRRAVLSNDAVSEAASSVVRLRCGRKKRNMTSSARKKANAPKAGYTTPLNWLAVGSELMMYTRSVGCTSTCWAPVPAVPTADAAAAAAAPVALLVVLLVAEMDTGCRRDAIVRRLFVLVDAPSGSSAADDSN